MDGVMERPWSMPGASMEDLQKEKDKWDAWNSQRGLSRTESKRRYVEALIDTMHRYATTPYDTSPCPPSSDWSMANKALGVQGRQGTRDGAGIRLEPNQTQLSHCI